MPDHIFLYVSAAITLMVVIVSLLAPRPSSERQRTRERQRLWGGQTGT
jgi:hypothetical protein